MSKYTEPKIVTEWRERIKNGPPKCCHTCDFYTKAGFCNRFKSEPPEEFAASLIVCEQWVESIPF